MHKRTAALLAKMGRGGAGNIEATLQMHSDDNIPFFFRHFVKNYVAEDAGIVDDTIDLAIGINGLLDHGLC